MVDKYKTRVMAWRKRNPDKVREYARKYYHKIKDRDRVKLAERSRNYRLRKIAEDPEWDRKVARKLSEKEPTRYKRLHRTRLEKIAGRLRPSECEICGRGGRICFDHCHSTGEFRGWLCINCNMVLGGVQDNPELLRNLALYVEKHRDGKTNGSGSQEDSSIAVCRTEQVLSS